VVICIYAAPTILSTSQNKIKKLKIIENIAGFNAMVLSVNENNNKI